MISVLFFFFKSTVSHYGKGRFVEAHWDYYIITELRTLIGDFKEMGKSSNSAIYMPFETFCGCCPYNSDIPGKDEDCYCHRKCSEILNGCLQHTTLPD